MQLTLRFVFFSIFFFLLINFVACRRHVRHPGIQMKYNIIILINVNCSISMEIVVVAAERMGRNDPQLFEVSYIHAVMSTSTFIRSLSLSLNVCEHKNVVFVFDVMNKGVFGLMHPFSNCIYTIKSTTCKNCVPRFVYHIELTRIRNTCI